jgi:hypothetical protein
MNFDHFEARSIIAGYGNQGSRVAKCTIPIFHRVELP